MYDKRNIIFILTSLEAIEKIAIYTEGIKTAEEFIDKKDQLIFNACQTLLMIIGEETKKLDTIIKEEHSSIPWRQIAQLRNRIAHDYRSINPAISFDVVRNYLDPLKRVLVEIIDQIEYPAEKLHAVLDSPFYSHIRYLKK